MARGGGRHFSRDLDPRKAQPAGGSDESEEEEESSDDDQVASGPNRANPITAAVLPASMAGLNLKLGNTEPVAEPEMSRAERKALKKAQSLRTEIQKDDESEEDDDDEEEEEDDDDLLNPHKATEKRQAQKAQAKANPVVKAPAPVATKTKPAVQEMTRKEK